VVNITSDSLTTPGIFVRWSESWLIDSAPSHRFLCSGFDDFIEEVKIDVTYRPIMSFVIQSIVLPLQALLPRVSSLLIA